MSTTNQTSSEKKEAESTSKFKLNPLLKDILLGVMYAAMIALVILFSRAEETSVFIYNTF